MKQLKYCLENYKVYLYLIPFFHHHVTKKAQSITCLTTDARLTADPGVTSSIHARSHTFAEIEHEFISMVILLPSANLFKKGCLSVTIKSMYTNYWLTACSSLPRKKSAVR